MRQAKTLDCFICSSSTMAFVDNGRMLVKNTFISLLSEDHDGELPKQCRRTRSLPDLRACDSEASTAASAAGSDGSDAPALDDVQTSAGLAPLPQAEVPLLPAFFLAASQPPLPPPWDAEAHGLSAEGSSGSGGGYDAPRPQSMTQSAMLPVLQPAQPALSVSDSQGACLPWVPADVSSHVPSPMAWHACHGGAWPVQPDGNPHSAQAAHAAQAFGQQCARIVDQVRSRLLAKGHAFNVETSRTPEGWHIEADVKEVSGEVVEKVHASSRNAISALVETNDRVRLLGRRAEPFTLTAKGLEATLASVDGPSEVCWDLYETGGCTRGAHCKWPHPTCYTKVTVAVRAGRWWAGGVAW